MIFVETKLRKIPEKCTKCKYSFVHVAYLSGSNWRCCSLRPTKNGHEEIPKKFVWESNNWVYVRPKWCPLKEV